jgi:hypothetical protein
VIAKKLHTTWERSSNHAYMRPTSPNSMTVSSFGRIWASNFCSPGQDPSRRRNGGLLEHGFRDRYPATHASRHDFAFRGFPAGAHLSRSAQNDHSGTVPMTRSTAS